MSSYRDAAQPGELAELDALDRVIAEADEQRRRAVDQRNRLVNRLVKRTRLRERYGAADVSRAAKQREFT